MRPTISMSREASPPKELTGLNQRLVILGAVICEKHRIGAKTGQ
jgi:hypothetical protein